MISKRRRFSGELKAKVALEALRGDRTLQEIASQHQVHPNQVGAWKRQAMEGLVEVFSKGAERRVRDHESEVRDPARLSSADPRSSPARAMERGRSAAISTSPLALRGLPRRGEDLARARARGPTRPRQHEDPGLPHGRGDQSQAARHRSSCHSLGHLGVSSRREASAVRPSCPHTPN